MCLPLRQGGGEGEMVSGAVTHPCPGLCLTPCRSLMLSL